MFSRREFLKRSVEGSSLLALGATVPDFVASTAVAAENGKDTVLVVLEMGGGNDGLNTVIPYGDDLYYKARPTLGIQKEQAIRVNDHIGLHPSLRGLNELLQNDRLAIVQGVGYPNPNRSHFESMDIWQSADPRGTTGNGWLGRAIAELNVQGGRIPAFHVGKAQLPRALQGSATAVPSLNTEKPFGLDLIGEFYGHQPDGGNRRRAKAGKPSPRIVARKQAIEDVARRAPDDGGSLLQFVRRTSLDTYATVDQLKEIVSEEFEVPDAQGDFSEGRYRQLRSGLRYELMLVARMIRAGFGTRIFYVSIDGFDTHSQQRQTHQRLLNEVGGSVQAFFNELQGSGDADRVVLMTFSEFGRRVNENGSKGTDHGSGSSLFLAGPAVKSGLIGDHPSLAKDDLERGDLKYHTDFRGIYATLLDGWLGCDSRRVLGDKFEHEDVLDEWA